MSLVNNSANNFKDFLDAIKPYLNYQFYDLSGQGVEANNFSTDEKVIGTWIDGKPLYQKTVSATLSSDRTLLLSNVDKLSKAFGFISNGTWGYQIGFSEWNTGQNKMFAFAIMFNETEDKVYIDKKSFENGVVATITLCYTKTTDTPVASGEKIVGQWIDGKPLYEKTLTYQNITLTADSSYILDDLSSLNIDADECLLVKSFTAKVNDSNSIYMQSALSTNKISGQTFLQGTTLNFNSQSNKLIIISSYDTTLKKVSITIQYTKTT